MPGRVRVLAVDGGGIRGIIPATVLAEIERRTGRPSAELFELAAGTSTGGIIACAVAMPSEGGPAWRAAQVVELYEREGPEIFDRTVWQRIRSGEGLLDARYSGAALERALGRYLGDARLSETLVDLVVPTYDTAARRPYFFKSRRARERPAEDFPLRLVARATSAAPVYFEAVAVGDRCLIDGGVFAGNPAMSGFAEAQRHEPGAEVVLVSLGTGEQTRSLSCAKIGDWGLLEWGRPLIDVVFDGASDAVDYQLRHALGGRRYWRLQIPLTDANDDLDDASPGNIRALKEHGRRLIRERSADVDAICAALTA